MAQVSIVRPGEGEPVRLGPAIEMRILEDGSNTNHRLGIAVGSLAPHTLGPPQHRHAEHEEAFYVISGVVRFTVADQVHDVGPGTLVMVPTGAPHTFANPGDEPAVMLSTFTPDSYVQYFRDLSNASTAGLPPANETATIMAGTPRRHPPSTRPDFRSGRPIYLQAAGTSAGTVEPTAPRCVK